MFGIRPRLLFSLLAVMLMSPLLATVQTRGQEASPVPGASDAPIVWRTTIEGDLALQDRPTAIAGGRIFIVGPDDTVSARSIDDGALLWEESLPFALAFTEVAASDDVVAVTRGNQMHVFDAETGEPIWDRTTATPDDVFPMASFFENLLITSELFDDTAQPHSTGKIYGLSALDGSQVWLAETGGLDSWQIPVVAGYAFVSGSDGQVVAINAANGAIAWTGSASTTGYIEPVVAGNVVLAQGKGPGNQPTITAFNRLTGLMLWSVDTPGYLEGTAGSSAIVTETVSFARSGAAVTNVRALDLQSGTERWRIEGASVTAMASAGNSGFLALSTTVPGGGWSASVLRLDADSGNIAWTLELESQSFNLTPCGERLFVRHGAYVASVNQADGALLYDYAAGTNAQQVLCDGAGLVATVGRDGMVAVHDTSVAPDLETAASLNSPIPAPFFVTLPMPVPQEDDLVLGVWRGQVGAGDWIELPPGTAGLNGYVELGSVALIEAAEAREPGGEGASIAVTGTGEVFAVPVGGAFIRADGTSAASLYIAGLLPEEIASSIGSDVLPGLVPVGMVPVDDPPTGTLRIAVTAISPEVNTGIRPRLSAWPAFVRVTEGALDVPAAPGVQPPAEALIAPALSLLADAGEIEAIERDLIFSAVSSTAPSSGLLMMVEPATADSDERSCFGRCIVR